MRRFVRRIRSKNYIDLLLFLTVIATIVGSTLTLVPYLLPRKSDPVFGILWSGFDTLSVLPEIDDAGGSQAIIRRDSPEFDKVYELLQGIDESLPAIQTLPLSSGPPYILTGSALMTGDREQKDDMLPIDPNVVMWFTQDSQNQICHLSDLQNRIESGQLAWWSKFVWLAVIGTVLTFGLTQRETNKINRELRRVSDELESLTRLLYEHQNLTSGIEQPTHPPSPESGVQEPRSQNSIEENKADNNCIATVQSE